MSDSIIQVEGLGKRYQLGLKGNKHDTLREAIMGTLTAPWRRMRTLSGTDQDGDDTFWALRDVSFEVQPGEVLGIIGRNGAGKSTLLKILSRIVEPTEGRAVLKGRVASLLEVGTGFHPDLTGRENVYLNGAMLGMKKAEIDRHFDEIVDFSEIEKFLDTPVKRYSSGMYVRLAFAVAAHLEPEILICDEVLAVGDASFQRKCLGKMQEVSRGQGRTVLFVSHNMGAVQRLCKRAVLLEAGQIKYSGETSNSIALYSTDSTISQERSVSFPPTKRQADIREISVLSPQKSLQDALDLNDPIEVHIQYTIQRDTADLNLALVVAREGTPVFCSFDTDSGPQDRNLRQAGSYTAIARIPGRFLKAGVYTVSASAGYSKVGVVDDKPEALVFEIHEMRDDVTHKGYARSRAGIVVVPVQWSTVPTVS